MVKQGREKSKSLPRGVHIKLADGSISSEYCKIVQKNVSRNLNDFKNPIPLTFLVITGPNCLIGCHGLLMLYPRQLKAFKNATGQNLKAFDK